MNKNRWIYICFVLAVVGAALLGTMVFQQKMWAFFSISILLVSCGTLLYHLEQREMSVRKIVVIAVMTAISVAGRFLFAAVPGFKPVTAVVVITGMYCGYDAGFICGTFSAVISNFYFGQGPWTPFQMTAWGGLGLLAGLLAAPLKKSRPLLLLYAVFAGIMYSFFMDIWTVLWYNSGFNWNLYLAALGTAVPYTIAYAVSNVVFLGALEKPIGKKLERMKKKYGL